MNLVSNKIVSSVRTVLASTAVMFAMSSAAIADQVQYCEPIFSGGDSAYVPCISEVDLGNGHIVVYDNDGNIVHEEWRK